MISPQLEFPVYRKYSNNKSYFKDESAANFRELKITGSLIESFDFEAKILPDRNFIQDMLNLENGYWEPIDKEEWDAIFERLK